MKTQFKHLFSALLIATLTGGMFTLSGCPEDEACTTNEDCATGETCNTETSLCEAGGCANDAACTTAGELCFGEDEAAGTLGECRAPADCTEAADGAAYCAAQPDGAGKVCDAATKTCVVPAPTDEYRYILIEDVSMGGDSCNSTAGVPALPDPGADIMWVKLDNAAGEEIGNGKTVSFNEGTTQTAEPNGYKMASVVLDGTAPELGADLCPTSEGNRFNPNTVVSLGCGGSLFVEFVGDAGAEILIENTNQISVGEYAAFCNAAGGNPMGSDRYDVYLCRTAVGAQPTKADCGTKLNSASLGGILAPVTVNIAAE